MSAAAKWMRATGVETARRAAECRARTSDLPGSDLHAEVNRMKADAFDTITAHHAKAADALEALAVPGVARIMRAIIDARQVNHAGQYENLTAEQMKALAALARIASEGK